MKDWNIGPVRTTAITQAGELLAMRHTATARPTHCSPPACEEPALAEKPSLPIAIVPSTRGVAAMHGSTLLGYLMAAGHLSGMGAFRLDSPTRIHPGTRQGYRAAGHLYSALGELWVNMGIFFHFAPIPAGDRTALEGLFSLSFGMEQIHGLADLEKLDSLPITSRKASPSVAPGWTIARS